MLDHMVWMKFKDGVSAERVAEHMANLNALIDTVPGVVACRAGVNITDRAGGMTHGLMVTFRDRAGLDAYLPHPNHVAVAAPMKEDCAQVMAMDIEY